MNGPARLLYICAHEDLELLVTLDKHLSSLKSEGVLKSWHRQLIDPGDEVELRTTQWLAQADIVMLLVSSDLLASREYIAALDEAKARPVSQPLTMIPVLARAVDWVTSEIGMLSPLPADGRPVTSCANRDEAWLAVAIGLRNVLAGLGTYQPATMRKRSAFAVASVTILLGLLACISIEFWSTAPTCQLSGHQGGVVVASPSLDGMLHFGSNKLCRELVQLAPGKVCCVQVSPGSGIPQLRKEASDAGATLLVVTDSASTAQIHALVGANDVLMSMDPIFQLFSLA